MKYIIIILLSLTIKLFSQVSSTVEYTPGSEIYIGADADICADEVLMNGTFSGSGTICQGALPVGLVSLSYAILKRDVIINWVTAWELNNNGFELERRKIDTLNNYELWSKIGFVPGKGNSNTYSSYSFTDNKLSAGSYFYRLKQIDYNGNYEYFYINDEIIVKIPENFYVSQNYPNPSNPNSKIDFQLPQNGNVLIKIYDILGAELATILNEDKKAGYYSVEFDGSKYASGVYFYSIASGNFKIIKKMIIVK